MIRGRPSERAPYARGGSEPLVPAPRLDHRLGPDRGGAGSIYQLVHHRNPPKRATLGAKVHEIKKSLPPELAEDYKQLVEARNYLAHEVLFDCGGWTGIIGWDPPSTLGALYEAITTARATIERVSKLLSQHLVDAGYPVMIAEIGSDGVTQLQPAATQPQRDPETQTQDLDKIVRQSASQFLVAPQVRGLEFGHVAPEPTL